MSTALRLTVEEFDRMTDCGAFERLPKRIELVAGELREMNPAGPLHEDIISFLNRWSTTNTRADQVNVRVQCSLGIPQLSSVPEPNLAWVQAGRYRHRRPQPGDVLLVIEVADSSLDYDLGDKQALYAAAGIREYWVVDVSQQRVIVFRQPAKKAYRRTRTCVVGETLAPLAAPRAVLDLAELFL